MIRIRIGDGLQVITLLFSMLGVFVGFLNSCDPFSVIDDDTFGQQGGRNLLRVQEDKGIQRTTIDFEPVSLEVSKNGDVYVVAPVKNQVFKIIPKDGTVELVAGTPYQTREQSILPPLQSLFPRQSIFLRQSIFSPLELYRFKNEIKYIDGPASTAKFLFPVDLAIDGDNVYVADMVNNAIRKIHQSGAAERTVSTFAGNFYQSEDRSKNPQNKPFVLKVEKDQLLVKHDIKKQAGYTNMLFKPRGIVVHKGALYVANGSPVTTITKTDLKTRKTETVWAKKVFTSHFESGPPQNWLTVLNDIEIDSKGNMYVLASSTRSFPYRGRVFKVSSTGDVKAIDMNNVHAIALDSRDNLYMATMSVYVAHSDARRTITLVQIMIAGQGPWSTTGVFAGGMQGFFDGPRKQAQFGAVSDLAVDTQGNVYVADVGNNAIRVINKSGEVMTIASKKAPDTPRR